MMRRWVGGLFAVLAITCIMGKPIPSAEQVEDIVAYLMTLSEG